LRGQGKRVADLEAADSIAASGSGTAWGGEQVVPKDAEDVLLEHPAVAQALVVPVPDPKMGETDAADIPLTPSGRPRKFILAERATRQPGLV
jgi:acyl-CoA synthetase (AMP-forming)/AMP-acid ligase II